MTGSESLIEMRHYFDEGRTRSYTFRKKQLEIFRDALLSYREKIDAALFSDLHKSEAEAWATETGLVLGEINYLLKNLRKLMRVKKAGTNFVNFPGVTRVYPDPLGVVLIIAPWNYPVQLLLLPLAGAIAGGNCVVLKPSELAPATSSLLAEMIAKTFDPNYIRLIEGDGAKVIPHMMDAFRFDKLFYTGSTHVGRILYEKAARQLVPVVLELGGKSPAIVESDADLEIAARRIAVGKFLNAGQTCIAPDYVLVHRSAKDALIQKLRHTIVSFYGDDPAASQDYGRLINKNRFDRILALMKEAQVVHGGRSDSESLYVEPTIIDDVDLESSIMNEEIFGPLLPIICFDTHEEAVSIVRRNNHPLALYLFTNDDSIIDSWMQAIPFGGGCINNTAWHYANHNIPFGGVANSGIGSYHGKYSFAAFTRDKPVMQTPTWLDPSIKYPPFTKNLWLLRKLIR